MALEVEPEVFATGARRTSVSCWSRWAPRPTAVGAGAAKDHIPRSRHLQFANTRRSLFENCFKFKGLRPARRP